MYLKKLKIKNWQCIKETYIEFENLMLFIGQSNSGKTSIMAAIMYFLGFRNFRPRDIRNGSNFTILEGRFYNSKQNSYFIDGKEYRDRNFWVKIVKDSNRKEQYFYRCSSPWREICEEEYNNIMKLIQVMYIPTISEKEETQYFVRCLLKNIDTSKIDESASLNKVINIFKELNSDYTSHGLYRNLIFEIICEIAYQSQKIGHSILKDTLLIFEEPELYLHPQREKELFSCLNTITKLGAQIYVTTHSSNFVSLYKYRSICIIRNNLQNGSRVFQYKGKLFYGDEIKNFNMNYWINPDRSELFFAKKVILVEGQTDKIVLGYLAKKLGVYKYDYSIVECGSKSLIPQFIKLLNIFKIPYVAIYDKDNHYWRTQEELEHSNERNKIIQRAINPKIGYYIEFENDIEEEIYTEKRERRNYKNKPFYALKTVSSEEYHISNSFKKKILRIFS